VGGKIIISVFYYGKWRKVWYKSKKCLCSSKKYQFFQFDRTMEYLLCGFFVGRWPVPG